MESITVENIGTGAQEVNFSGATHNQSSSLGIPSSQKEQYYNELYRKEAVVASNRAEKIDPESQDDLHKLISKKLKKIKISELQKYT